MIKWIARIALITVVLGLVGTVIIVRNLKDAPAASKTPGADARIPPVTDIKSSPEAVKTALPDQQPETTLVHEQPEKTDQKVELPENRPANTNATNNRTTEETDVTPRQDVVIEKKETAVTKIISLKKSAEKITKISSPATEPGKKAADKFEEAAKKEKTEKRKRDEDEKLFTRAELQHLVNRINRARGKKRIYSNCVQIYITDEGNYKRTLSQIETYLKGHSFSIAGREVVSGKVKGIAVAATSGCVRITVGSF